MYRYRNKNTNGFTYPLILLIIATIIVGAAITNRVTSTLSKREKETELLQRGYYYVKAIENYYNSSAFKQYPSSLEDLLMDPRFPYKVHLRKLYRDPFADKGLQEEPQQWELILNETGEIVGVASKSDKKPLKTLGFPNYVMLKNGGEKYSDWAFIFKPDYQMLDNNVNAQSN